MSSNFGGRGWSVIMMCMICYFIAGGLGADGKNIYIGAISALRGWERGTILSLSTYAGWIGIVMTLVFASIIAKNPKSIKFVMGITMILEGLTFLMYGRVNNFGLFVVCNMIFGCVACGFGTVAPNTIQAIYFPKKKALALGWSTMGYPLCTAIWPLVMNKLLGFGVEMMFTIVGLAVAIMGVIMLFWCKPIPQEVGYAPDNDPDSAAAVEHANIEEYKSDLTFGKMLSMKNTWLIIIGMGFMWFVTTCIVTQLVPRLMQVGYEQNAAIAMLSVMGVFGIFGSYAWGWLDQKINTKRATIVYGFWYVVALVLLIWLPNIVVAYIAVFMVGISVGGICNLIPSMVSSVYGWKDFAAANRVTAPLIAIITSCSGLYLGQMLRINGTFVPSYIGLIGFTVVSIILTACITYPKNRA